MNTRSSECGKSGCLVAWQETGIKIHMMQRGIAGPVDGGLLRLPTSQRQAVSRARVRRPMPTAVPPPVPGPMPTAGLPAAQAVLHTAVPRQQALRAVALRTGMHAAVLRIRIQCGQRTVREEIHRPVARSSVPCPPHVDGSVSLLRRRRSTIGRNVHRHVVGRPHGSVPIRRGLLSCFLCA